MKNFFRVSLAALALAGVVQAKHFDGSFVGLNAGYKFGTVDLKEKETGVKDKLKPTSPFMSLTGGYGETVGSVYLGGDVRVGYDFGSWKKKDDSFGVVGSTIKAKPTWTMGAGVLVGGECSSDCLLFLRLGVDYLKYKFNGSRGAQDVTGKFHSWGFVPGLGFRYKIDKDWAVGGMYEYTMGFAGKQIEKVVKTEVSAHAVSVVVSYLF